MRERHRQAAGDRLGWPANIEIAHNHAPDLEEIVSSHDNKLHNHSRHGHQVGHTKRSTSPAKKFQASCFASLLLLILLQLISRQLTRAQPQQFQRSLGPQSLAHAQNLVNVPPPQAHHQQQQYVADSKTLGEQAPLVRPPLQQADLDNVIESTTATSSSVNNNNMQAGYLARLFQQQNQPSQQQQQGQTCQLPHTWAGKWYQANKDPIRVTNTEISDRGICRDKKGDKYLFEYTSNGPRQAQQQSSQQHTPSNALHLANQATQSGSTCLICLVINERHLNVLQYKESSCQPIPGAYLNKSQQLNNDLVQGNDHSLLDSICSEITGDAQLESLFRLDTPAIECPISGKYQFTYDNCKEPQSSLDSCMDRKQLNFKFAACPDVPGSESKAELLKCYADWVEGNNYYMIGRLESASSSQDRGKFRCFLYEKSADGQYIQMAQSLGESCHGLITASEGDKTLRLTARQQVGTKCHLPAYIQGQSENWLSVDNSLIYMFNQNSTKYQVKETKEGNVIEEATCLQQITYQQPTSSPMGQQQAHPRSAASAMQFQARNQVPASPSRVSSMHQQVGTPASRRFQPSSNHFNQIDQSQVSSGQVDVVYLVQITKSCFTTDYCVRFHRRTSGILQIDYFVALDGEDGHQRCRNAHIQIPQTQIITSTNLEPQRCPLDGAYTIEAPPASEFSYNPSNIFICPRQSYLTAQCEQQSHMKIHYRCSPDKRMAKNLYCLGSWTTGKFVRLILADDERQRYSAWYQDYGLALGNPEVTAEESSTVANTLARSQPSIGSSQTPSLASIVDLQIALLTAPLPILSKPMQVRLTRRTSCTDLRGLSSQNSLATSYQPSLLPIPSYASPSATSAAQNRSPANCWHSCQYCPATLTLLTTLVMYLLSSQRLNPTTTI